MKAYELIEWLNEHHPQKFAEDWDNVGLLVGDDQKEISHVFLALDLTEPVLDEAVAAGADMILTHHPMIFSGIKKINNHTFTGRKILRLIKEDIPYFAMHTNYDVIGMADLSADHLKLQDTREADSGGETEAGTTQRDVVRHGVARIPVSFSVTAKWLKKLAGYAKLDKISVQYFDVETSELKLSEMYVTGYKAKLKKDTSYKGLWTVSFTLKEM